MPDQGAGERRERTALLDCNRWMYHCHILGHAERGMMGELQVDP
jgi:FtsP/CotA-like multicopper oxidase with cupredoxin domain